MGLAFGSFQDEYLVAADLVAAPPNNIVIENVIQKQTTEPLPMEFEIARLQRKIAAYEAGIREAKQYCTIGGY